MSIIIIECKECEFPFGIKSTYLQISDSTKANVKRSFHCPYCVSEHGVGIIVKIGERVVGGVSIKGSNLSVRGDIVGGDLVRNG